MYTSKTSSFRSCQHFLILSHHEKEKKEKKLQHYNETSYELTPKYTTSNWQLLFIFQDWFKGTACVKCTCGAFRGKRKRETHTLGFCFSALSQPCLPPSQCFLITASGDKKNFNSVFNYKEKCHKEPPDGIKQQGHVPFRVSPLKTTCARFIFPHAGWTEVAKQPTCPTGWIKHCRLM